MIEPRAVRPDRHIWLIDRRKHWRELFTGALRRDGFIVSAIGEYDYPSGGGKPTLVILSCTAITRAERLLIDAVTARHHRLLVLAATLPTDVMRQVFLAGAYDATIMPTRTGDFVDLVKETLGHSETPSIPSALLMAGT